MSMRSSRLTSRSTSGRGSFQSAPSLWVFNSLAYLITGTFTIVCLFPFVLLISGSITSEASLFTDGFRIIPRVISFDAYQSLFSRMDVIGRAYATTIGVTAAGTFLALFMTSMAGYVLQRKDFRYRNRISFFIYFTSLFSGGLVPWYIMIVKYLHLKDTYAALVLPALVSPFLIILMKTFMRSVPESISESAKLDGADDFTIYRCLILPLSKPALATIGLFIALNYWNDWFLSALFIDSREKYTLQFFLFNMLREAEFYRTGIAANIAGKVPKMPAETMKMATAVVVTGPIIFLYPFVQRYFVSGLTVGSVKG